MHSTYSCTAVLVGPVGIPTSTTEKTGGPQTGHLGQGCDSGMVVGHQDGLCWVGISSETEYSG